MLVAGWSRLIFLVLLQALCWFVAVKAKCTQFSCHFGRFNIELKCWFLLRHVIIEANLFYKISNS